jgi:Uncharacterised nucleotidyltransferase
VTEPWEKLSLLDRMVLAVELVRQKLNRAVAALEAAGIPYAVAGGNAVAAWVATIDPGAVRNTADVDIRLRREDLQRARHALESAGFVYRHTSGIDMFLDGPNGRAREAIHIVPAREKIRPEYDEPSPDVSDAATPTDISVVKLESLVKMKLTSFRRKDQVHLQDMLEVGLIDPSWVSRFSPELGARLQQLIDSPEG